MRSVVHCGPVIAGLMADITASGRGVMRGVGVKVGGAGGLNEPLVGVRPN